MTRRCCRLSILLVLSYCSVRLESRLISFALPFFSGKIKSGKWLARPNRLCCGNRKRHKLFHTVSRNYETNGLRNNPDIEREFDLIADVSPEHYNHLPSGIPNVFFVVKEYTFSPCCETELLPALLNELNRNHVNQLGLSLHNVTVPFALVMVDPETYPSLSRARKACRKGSILIVRQSEVNATECQKFIGRVGDRVYFGDKICVQVRMGDGSFSGLGHRKPPFELPVVYQDDHFALVNKPAGIVCYRQGSGQVGLLSVRSALPFVLDPPRYGTHSVLRRPASVHRLDKPTSGLLCIVKTKPALVSMSRQFHDRVVRKTYMAIVNGIPEENAATSISSEEAVAMGLDVDQANYDKGIRWQIVDSPLDDKHAVTIWRAVRYIPSLRARDGFLTLVELKPKTGRYHQLRRHMSWNAQRAIVGDTVYDGGHPNAKYFRGSGLFLCASGIAFEHPYYNTVDGQVAWKELDENTNDFVRLSSSTGKIMVFANVAIPTKFTRLLEREELRFKSFNGAL